MKERQRWQAEEDALLRAYVKQYGPREWHLASQRMRTPLNRDPKACLERWKNYLRPGIKKGSLTEEEQHLVIHLQAKHGNKWKKIAAEVPGRTAKRLGKWWEVFKEKQQRKQKDSATARISDLPTTVDGKYKHILETFAEKLVKQQQQHSDSVQGFLMATSNGRFLNTDPPTLLPPWLSNSAANIPVRPPSPSVTLTLSPSTVPPPPSPGVTWLRPETATDNVAPASDRLPSRGIGPLPPEKALISELLECCKELEEKHSAWAAHKKEAAWRLRRVELQLESEKACKRMEKMEEIEAKVKALRDEQKATLEWIEAEYREQLAGLRRDAESKEQKLAEQWAAKQSRLTHFLEQMGCQSKFTDPNAGC